MEIIGETKLTTPNQILTKGKTTIIKYIFQPLTHIYHVCPARMPLRHICVSQHEKMVFFYCVLSLDGYRH